MDKKLTVSEAAERAGILESLVYQLCEERRLIHFRFGKKGGRYWSTPATLTPSRGGWALSGCQSDPQQDGL